MKSFTQTELQALQESHESWVMSQPGVQGVSIGLGRDGNPRLRIFTHQIAPSTRQEIAKKLAGAPIDWDEGGEIVAY